MKQRIAEFDQKIRLRTEKRLAELRLGHLRKEKEEDRLEVKASTSLWGHL
jgi:hypothetical protein